MVAFFKAIGYLESPTKLLLLVILMVLNYSMNLHDRLAEIRHAFETGDTPKEIIDVLNENVEKLLAANVSEHALKVGEQAPLDSLVQSRTGAKPLSSFLNGQFLVLTWFRGNW